MLFTHTDALGNQRTLLDQPISFEEDVQVPIHFTLGRFETKAEGLHSVEAWLEGTLVGRTFLDVRLG